MADTIIAIPARHGSRRFPGKPLAKLTGCTGQSRSLIERSWRAAKQVAGVDAVYVVTDDDRIAEHAEGFGAEVIMTSDECRNGTERCAEAAASLPTTPGIVVNLQGDSPLTRPDHVEALIAAVKRDKSVAVATPVVQATDEQLERLRDDRRNDRVGATTAVFRENGDALYFSKEIVPYSGGEEPEVFYHLGLYAYRMESLAQYSLLRPGRLEEIEGLEQLRFLEEGMTVRCVEVAQSGDHWELNNPGDVAILEDIFKREGIE
ncbi:3-deoxy-manno-octulosonate cytidylyltransferase [Tranquillimonas alkanivorans]|uniref:3-deoxy-manno-octulosonate cytidylyltransferase (CMP-KDO synthetase) n=1 Tax=Tranquillimonas alkanivorans TaxID=441119 RepID=A0A1I5L6B1_9RHOB|nr:3-deoxy-manno-octulosonate cytidylyltransferase [Tranquillimonas alkanivorans]SFO92787.1 3-deoxy-manno-octulosonate cytidylyltransferase (CMP-KDO synthetase) [Tranquillimonas alkanivorans]